MRQKLSLFTDLMVQRWKKPYTLTTATTMRRTYLWIRISLMELKRFFKCLFFRRILRQDTRFMTDYINSLFTIHSLAVFQRELPMRSVCVCMLVACDTESRLLV